MGSARSGTRVGLHNGLFLDTTWSLEHTRERPVTLTALQPFAVWKFPRKIEPRLLQTQANVETDVDKS